MLGYLHKEDTKLKPYEGVRVAEIQAAGQVEGRLLKDWAWIEGEDNPADWVTKPRKVHELAHGGFWQTGPKFLTTVFEMWPIKLSFQTDKLEGELVPKEVVNSTLLTVTKDDEFGRVLDRSSSLEKCHRILAYVMRWKSVETMTKEPLSAAEIEMSKTR